MTKQIDIPIDHEKQILEPIEELQKSQEEQKQFNKQILRELDQIKSHISGKQTQAVQAQQAEGDSVKFRDLDKGAVFTWHGCEWKKVGPNHAETVEPYREYVPGDDAVETSDEPQEEPYVESSPGHQESKTSQPSDKAEPEKPDAGTP